MSCSPRSLSLSPGSCGLHDGLHFSPGNGKCTHINMLACAHAHTHTMDMLMIIFLIVTFVFILLFNSGELC